MTNDKLADELEQRVEQVVDGEFELGVMVRVNSELPQIIAALRRSESERNQCDGCARNLQLGKNGIHYELDGTPVMGCTAHLYERQPSSDKVLVPRDATIECPHCYRRHTIDGSQLQWLAAAEAEGHHE